MAAWAVGGWAAVAAGSEAMAVAGWLHHMASVRQSRIQEWNPYTTCNNCTARSAQLKQAHVAVAAGWGEGGAVVARGWVGVAAGWEACNCVENEVP